MFRRVRRGWERFLRVLDDESIDSFQVMYYTIFTAFAAMVIFLPHQRQEARDFMATPIYVVWLMMNLLCPLMTLLGRRIQRRTAVKRVGENNYGVGAAWLRLTGDLGVWWSVNLWTLVLFQTGWWESNLFVVYFMSMGVFGGFMFTLRSLRRLQQIRHIERNMP